MYKLPIGVSIPSIDDFTNGEDIELINKERDRANINEGFTLKDIEDKKYDVFVEANIDCDKLWKVFLKLVDELLPEEAYGIIGVKDEELTLSDFTEKGNILEIYSDYEFEICNDGFIQCGIAYYDEDNLTEILIRSFKYMQVWSTEKDKLISILESFNLYEEIDLKFIDEYPVISSSLTGLNYEACNFIEVVDSISEKFERLT